MSLETDETLEASEASGGPGDVAYGLLRLVMDVRRSEVAALGWSWLYIFAVLSSYYIMRPIRDQMGVAGGVNNLPWLFTGTLAGMLILNLPFAYLVKTLPRSRFIPITNRFFAANILIFALALRLADAQQTIWVGRVFFIWISVFNLFVVSVFWAMIVDVFSSEQGKRLFGFIAAGATIGAITGSSVTASLAEHLPPTYLLIGAALLLELAVFGVRHLSRLSAQLRADPVANGAERPIGGNVLAGITQAFKNPYLINTAAFLLLYAITSTLLYFQQAGIVSANFTDRGAQTAFFAKIDLYVNVLTLVVQLLLTGRILRLLGVGLTLALLPALSVVGFGVLALAPTIAAIVVFQVIRRAGNFAIARPTREVLFTVVPREDRYKAKNFIDTVVYRTGDQVGAWSYALIGALGWGGVQMSAIAVALSLIWLVNSLWLGRRQEEIAAAQALPEPDAVSATI
ncbi:ATP:ADP antiporter, AAA family [Rhizobiales bacterium GAS191]|nr:ATP:ADP antiporter, AAA family [Rhizobiales bacterium GAS113]SEC49896.1 ATP:ADP antiporter, AAA family [Rhizobiales bacterium GAS191]